MKLALVALVCIGWGSEALALSTATLTPRLEPRTSTPSMQFGRQKKTVPTLEERGYWAGQ
eukprot:scaffold287828_cov33-Tisochrysis_lutea.AAC.1